MCDVTGVRAVGRGFTSRASTTVRDVVVALADERSGRVLKHGQAHARPNRASGRLARFASAPVLAVTSESCAVFGAHPAAVRSTGEPVSREGRSSAVDTVVGNVHVEGD
jgi:hypothetical protein